MKPKEKNKKKGDSSKMEREEIKVSGQDKKTEVKKKWTKEMVIATVLPWMLCAMVVCIQLGGNVVFAAANASSETKLILTALDWVAYLGMFLGAIYFVVGCIHYAGAHAEGDGPAKQKAQGQIAAAVMIFAVCGLITLKASDIVNMIQKPATRT